MVWISSEAVAHWATEELRASDFERWSRALAKSKTERGLATMTRMPRRCMASAAERPVASRQTRAPELRAPRKAQGLSGR